MDETDKTKLTEEIKVRLNKITEIKIFFDQEIIQRKLCSNNPCKYVTTFDYIDKIFIVLSTTSGRASIISFTSVAEAPVGIVSASFTLIFSLTTGIVKND